MTDAISQHLVGTWRLVSYRVAAGEDTEEPMGPEPQGRLIYEACGRMMVQLVDPRVPHLASSDPRVFTDAEARAALVGLIAYFGTYTLRAAEGAVIHHVEASSLPNWRNGDQVRYFEFSDDRLTLRTPPIVLGGRETIGTLVWERLAG